MSATPTLAARHQSSGLNSTFHGEGLSFTDYVKQSRQMIAAARAKLPSDDAAHELAKIIDGNAPFELKPHGANIKGKNKPYQRGILLTHGLSDSPYFMRYLGAFFQAQGFRVRAILLPGHGTQPGDLLDVNWREWARAVDYGVDQLAAEVDEIYLAGFSAGGTLSVFQSLIDERVRGLFLFSPALKISSLAAYANLHKLYSWLAPAQKWINIFPDTDIYKYESLPKNAAAQMYALTQEVERRVQDRAPTLPIFTAASVQDSTVDSTATLTFMACLENPLNKLVLYAADKRDMGNKNPLSNFPAAQLEWIPSALAEQKNAEKNNAEKNIAEKNIVGQKILSSAHTSVVLPAEDAHYGAHGNYANCLHYYPHDMEKYNACKSNPEACLLGETTAQNLQAGLLRRLTYNPHFAALQVSMKGFIEGLPSGEVVERTRNIAVA